MPPSKIKPAFEFEFTVKVKLTKESAGPRADEDYLLQEVVSRLEEMDGESFYSDEDTEYAADVTVSQPG